MFRLLGSKLYFIIIRLKPVVVLAGILLLMMNLRVFSSEESNPEFRKFDEKLIEKISQDDNFFYLQKEETLPGINLAALNWIQKMLNWIFGNRFAQAIFSNFHLIILFIALVLVVMKITHLSPAKIFYKLKKAPPESFSIDEQSIASVDFADLIAAALQKKNYRLALRYHYLELLKILADKEFIEWNPHKTNYEIVDELRGKPFRDNFRSLALVFEYVWYGEFKINENGFLEVKNDFMKLKKQIS